jgi:hypothetical protein
VAYCRASRSFSGTFLASGTPHRQRLADEEITTMRFARRKLIDVQ